MEKREEEEEKEGEKIMGGLQSVASWLEWDLTKKSVGTFLKMWFNLPILTRCI